MMLTVNLTKWTHFSPGAIEHQPVIQEAHVTSHSTKARLRSRRW